MDFDYAQSSKDLTAEVRNFMTTRILPRNRDWLAWAESNEGDPPWMESLRDDARRAGLWNMALTSLPEGQPGRPLSNLGFAPIAEEMGRLPWAPLVFNCHAPDVPNMITLIHEATTEQKEQWLHPLLQGRTRSAFAMTEPENGSSDARNISMRIERTERGYRLNGRKWFVSGAGHPNCSFLIVIGALTDAPERSGHTALIVPMEARGLKLVRQIRYLGWQEATGPIGELNFENVEVPHNALLGAEGQGFAVAQTRLGPARVQHCMRAIGLAETVVGLMVARAGERRTFGRTLNEYDTVQGWIARSRIEIEQARLIVLKCAWLLDQSGHKGAWRDVSIAKVAVPAMLNSVIDRALQLFGAMGGTDDTPLHGAMAWARAFRIFDGPDEVHLRQIFRQEPPASVPLAESEFICKPTLGDT